MATEERRRGHCAECGDDDVKMAITHVCFKCYMRQRREAEQPDQHNPSLRKEHIALLKLHAKQMEVLAGLKVGEPTKKAVMTALGPHFHLIAHLVNLDETVPPDGPADDDGERLTPEDEDDDEASAATASDRNDDTTPESLTLTAPPVNVNGLAQVVDITRGVRKTTSATRLETATTLDDAVRELEAAEQQWFERVRRRAESKLKALVRDEFNSRVKRAFPAVADGSFKDIGARRRAAEKRTGLARDEVFGGVLDVGTMLSINNGHDVHRCLEAAQRPERAGGDPSILTRLEQLGIIGGLSGYGAVVKRVEDAWQEVPEPARVKKLRQVVEELTSQMPDAPPDDATMVTLSRFGRGRRRYFAPNQPSELS